LRGTHRGRQTAHCSHQLKQTVGFGHAMRLMDTDRN
jgi:hypothetical protein